MTKIIYRGPSDFRVLAKGDIAGVDDYSKTEFTKDEAININDEAAKLILADLELYGNFELAHPEAEVALFEVEATEEPKPSIIKPSRAK